MALTAASPHTRGWTRRCLLQHPDRDGFPAHAGMDPSRCAATRPSVRLPRTRGDGPLADYFPREHVKASPHTRGWTRGEYRGHGSCRGFPAHAGMDPQEDYSFRDRPAASPHTRGWTRSTIHGETLPLGFPAHAGMDRMERPRPRRRRRLPRTRGDGPSLREGLRRPAMGFPAHAGMDPP